MRPERAVVVPYALHEKELPAFVRGWDRVYVGSSFCPGLLPSARRVAALFGAGARAVTVLTPFVTDAQLAVVLGKVGGMFRGGLRPEIAVSDLGLLQALRSGPCGAAAFTLGLPLSHDFLRMPGSFLKKFFARHGIGGLETDEFEMVGCLAAAGIKVSLHYPLRYMAMSRCCPWTGRMLACTRPVCAGRKDVLTARGAAAPVIMSENAYFLRAGTPSGRLAVARTVYTSVD